MTLAELRRRLAGQLDLITLERDRSNLALVATDGAILWINAAWREFAASNGGLPGSTGVGANYFDAASGPLRAWIVDRVATCVSTAEPFECDYECSSPASRRFFRMRAVSVPAAGVLISHSLRVEVAHEAAPSVAERTRYCGPDDVIVMCSNCRRVRRDDTTWDWVPAWVGAPDPRTSHGICTLCFEYYWPAKPSSA